MTPQPSGRAAAPAAEASTRLIKKYSNRKLYDTRSRHYITLERIGELLRAGEDIKVVDRGSGEDLTAVTLSQVVLDTERKKHGAVPEQLLQQLVRNPGETVASAVRQAAAAGQDLVQRAEERLVRSPEVALEEALQRTLRGLKLPTRKDMETFDRRLRELTDRVDELTDAVARADGRRPAARRAAPKKRS